MWQVLKWNRKWDNACRLNKCCITSSPSYHAIWNLKILVRFELFISTERSLRTIRQLTNFRLYELTNVCEGVTGDQAESVRKHFATPAGFLHRRWLCNTPESRTVKKKKHAPTPWGDWWKYLKTFTWISLLQFDLSTSAALALGTEISGRCQEVAVVVNVWMFCLPGGKKWPL